MRTLMNDPEHWRHRAREARALANLIEDEQMRDAMLEIATEYDHLAARAADRAPAPVN